MILCWDNIENVRYKDGYFVRTLDRNDGYYERKKYVIAKCKY